MDIAAVFDSSRIVRLKTDGCGEFGQRFFVLAMPEVINDATRDMRFGQVWSELQSALGFILNRLDLRVREMVDIPMALHPIHDQPCMGQRKLRIEIQGLAIKRRGPVKIVSFEGSFGVARFEFGLEK